MLDEECIDVCFTEVNQEDISEQADYLLGLSPTIDPDIEKSTTYQFQPM